MPVSGTFLLWECWQTGSMAKERLSKDEQPVIGNATTDGNVQKDMDDNDLFLQSSLARDNNKDDQKNNTAGIP